MRKGIERNRGNFAEFPSSERTQRWWPGCCSPELAGLHADLSGFIITFHSCIFLPVFFAPGFRLVLPQ